jgi:hypothetical protein
MNLIEIGWYGVDWIHLAQDRDHLWAFGHHNEPTDPVRGRKYIDWLSDYHLLKKELYSMGLNYFVINLIP